jgi:hypothetical protein
MSAPIPSKIEVTSSRANEDVNESSTQDETPTPKVPVVRTLKPPPEIWELVHPVPPRQLTPARAFVGRLASSTWMIVLLAGVVVSIGVYVGLRSSQRTAGVTNTLGAPAKQVDSTKAEVGVSSLPAAEHHAPPPVVASTDTQSNEVGESENLRRMSSRGSKRVGAPTPVQNSAVVAETAVETKTASSPQPTDQTTQSLTSVTETAKDGSVDSVSPNRKSKTTLSPQLIDSPKTITPRKAKVIQWP